MPFPENLPFEIEPYRLLVAFVVTGWIGSLLVDPRVLLRRSGLEPPLLLFVGALLLSLVANQDRLQETSAGAIKELSFFASYVLVLSLIVSVVKRPAQIDFLVRVMVVVGGLVALFAVIERQTGFNLFTALADAIPFLEPTQLGRVSLRGDRLRATGSAQHPIALGAVLVMLVPLAVYLVRASGRRRWWLAVLALSLGALATVSRTSVLMLAVVVIVFLWLRPRQTARLLPALVPALLLVHFALPGTLHTLKDSFFPEGGIVAEQQRDPGWRGSGRIADLGPSLHQVAHQPLLGQGFGTRDDRQILDNQWLGTLLDTGVLGALSLAWLFLRFIRRAGRAARNDDTPGGWFLTAAAAAVAAYAIGMFTYDAFSFVQVTFALFIVLGLGSALLVRSYAREAPSEAIGALRALPESLAKPQG